MTMRIVLRGQGDRIAQAGPEAGVAAPSRIRLLGGLAKYAFPLRLSSPSHFLAPKP